MCKQFLLENSDKRKVARLVTAEKFPKRESCQKKKLQQEIQ